MRKKKHKDVPEQPLETATAVEPGKQPWWKKKPVLIGIGAILLIGAIGNALGGDDSEDTAAAPTTQASSPSPTPAPKPMEDEATEEEEPAAAKDEPTETDDATEDSTTDDAAAEEDDLAERVEAAALEAFVADSWSEVCASTSGWSCALASFESPSAGTVVVNLQERDEELRDMAARAVLQLTCDAVPDLDMVQAIDLEGNSIFTRRESLICE